MTPSIAIKDIMILSKDVQTIALKPSSIGMANFISSCWVAERNQSMFLKAFFPHLANWVRLAFYQNGDVFVDILYRWLIPLDVAVYSVISNCMLPYTERHRAFLNTDCYASHDWMAKLPHFHFHSDPESHTCHNNSEARDLPTLAFLQYEWTQPCFARWVAYFKHYIKNSFMELIVLVNKDKIKADAEVFAII